MQKSFIEKQLAKIDVFSGLEFEEFVANLLNKQGYKTTNIKDSGDFGVDVIAEKGGVRYALQVKRYKSNVSRTAISDAVAGKYHWNCDRAWVFTNSYFTADAITLAESTDCKLTNRDDLLKMLHQQKQWREELKKSRGLAFVNFTLMVILLGLIVIFIVKETRPEVWSRVDRRLFAPVSTFVRDFPSWVVKTLRPKEKEPSSSGHTLTPVEDDFPKSPILYEDGIPILQPTD